MAEALALLKSGLSRLVSQGFGPLKGRRLGLMTNPGATLESTGRTCYEVFTSALELDLRALFSPEHGFAAAAQDGVNVESSLDPRTGLPVYSLYGATLKPSPAMLAQIDLLVCDIQDVGARYYTYLWTISYILEAAGEHGVEVMILDRPNPLGRRVEGPLISPGFESFVGRYPIPVRYGMSVGELAQMFNALWNPTPCILTVLPGVEAAQSAEDGLLLERCFHWVPTSPNLTHFPAVLQYPGACLIEGTTLSEGRGTALPFEVVGAPWIESHDLAAYLNAQPFLKDYALFYPYTFQPTASKWAGQTCGGVRVMPRHTAQLLGWPALRVWLALIIAIRRRYPQDFAWKPTHFDRLMGSDETRNQIDSGANLEEITAEWGKIQAIFEAQRRPYLLY